MSIPPYPLTLKPDIEDTARRFQAYFAGEIIDRPVVCVTAPKPGVPTAPGANYHDRVHGDIPTLIDNARINAEATHYGGEAVPGLWLSFGPDEIAAFCGGELGWSEGSGDTNWSTPFVDDWATALPVAIGRTNWLYRRMLDYYRQAADAVGGDMLLAMPDLHTNMDLLAAMRGPEQLCFDLLECPERIDRAMADTMDVFEMLWREVSAAGRMDEFGYCGVGYAMEGIAVLQCDFCCMISPEMFDRWVLPALEAEAAIVKNVVYHWDGPGALVHTDSLVASAAIHTLAYVPGTGHGTHMDYLDMYRELQDRGKAIQVSGSIDEVKAMHKVLRPELTLYGTWASSPDEADALLEWFCANT